jgi:hypothetical protein
MFTLFSEWASDRPIPPTTDAVRVILPYSEVCMHMKVAGKAMWARIVNRPSGYPIAQLIDDDGRPYSAPITMSEAGMH